MAGISVSLTSGGVSGLLTGVGQFAKDIRSAITGEIGPEKKAEIEQKAMEIEFAAAQSQTAINLEEARHPNIFVAGWRPFVGWLCGASLGWHYIGNPVMGWIVQLAGRADIVPPALDTSELTTILFAMLGFGGMRMFEKLKGSSGNH